MRVMLTFTQYRTLRLAYRPSCYSTEERAEAGDFCPEQAVRYQCEGKQM